MPDPSSVKEPDPVLTRLRTHVSYANVTASLALFVALGGTSYAATRLASNTVGSAQIRRGAVGPSELRSQAVSSRTIRDRTVQTRDLATRTRDSLRGSRGPTGPAGPTGPKGDSPVSYRMELSSGTVIAGSATVVRRPAEAVSDVDFVGEVRLTSVPLNSGRCVAVASLSKRSSTLQPSGEINAEILDLSTVRVSTYDSAGNPAPLPFSLIVAC